MSNTGGNLRCFPTPSTGGVREFDSGMGDILRFHGLISRVCIPKNQGESARFQDESAYTGVSCRRKGRAAKLMGFSPIDGDSGKVRQTSWRVLMQTIDNSSLRSTTSAKSEIPVAFDDPVPADSGILRDPIASRPHSLERQVQRKLLAHPRLRFSSLVVRRTPSGICLEGVMTSTDGSDICALARQVEGVQQVLNHIMVHGTELPEDVS